MKELSILALCLSFFGTTQAQKVDSLDIMIGQMIIVGVHGKSIQPSDALYKEVQQGKVGGVIFYEKNIDPAKPYEGIKSINRTLQSVSAIPLFTAIDQEGGVVNRLKTKYGFPKSVTAEYLGKTDNKDTTYFYGEQTAKTLKKLGINTNFAPVVDLSINKNNPIIAKYGRAYGDDPTLVAKHAGWTIQAHRKYKIITSLKHFPGHGSSKSDTHLGIADVTKYWSDEELEPYRLLLQNQQVDAIMSAHIINKNLDPSGNPSTLSWKVMTELLRKKMGYNGVVFSDDMQMHAISKHFGLEKTIKMGIDAGLDVLMFSNNIKNTDQRAANVVHKMIKEMVGKGEISEDRIRQSYKRIIKLKQKYIQ